MDPSRDGMRPCLLHEWAKAVQVQLRQEPPDPPSCAAAPDPPGTERRAAWSPQEVRARGCWQALQLFVDGERFGFGPLPEIGTD